MDEEVAPLVSRLSGVGKSSLEGLRVWTGTLGGDPVAICVSGDGALAAREGARRFLGSWKMDALMAIGVGGALSPGFEIATTIVARRVLDGRTPFPPPAGELLGRALERSQVLGGTVVSWPEILVTRESKRDLRRSLGVERTSIVDLESAQFVREALARSIPWLVARAVSDTVEETLPLDFNLFRGKAGGLDRSKILAHAVRHPSIIRKLMVLRGRVSDCAAALADLIEGLVVS